MPVITNYSWRFVSNLYLTPTNSHADVTALANGGFAAIGDHGNHIDGSIFGSTGSYVDGWSSANGIIGAIDQLSNGNLVIASETIGGIEWEIVNSYTGYTVTFGFGDTGAFASQADVAAFSGGGFWIANQQGSTGPSGLHFNVVNFMILDNAGAFVDNISIDAPGTDNTGVSIAGLDNNTVAVAWTRQVGANTAIWYAVYNAAGGVIKAPARFDGIGTINRDVSLTAMDGGFAMAYEDNEYSSDVDITLAKFNFAGNLVNIADISRTSFDEDNPYVTRLGNGMLAVSLNDSAEGPSSDTYVNLIDPANLSVLASRGVLGGEAFTDDVADSSIAGFGLGRLAVFHTNVTDGAIGGEDLQGVRTSTGDGDPNFILGDDLVDIMNGGGGNDVLVGGLNDDELTGGEGGDHVDGGPGDDRMDGGVGADTLAYLNAIYAARIDLRLTAQAHTGGQGTDTVSGFENVLGGDFDDILIGTDSVTAPNTIFAGAGIDRVYLLAGDDFAHGDEGTDSIHGGPGNDRIDGGNDNDTWLGGDAGLDTITGGPGNDRIDGGADNDTWLGGGGGIDYITGGDGDDRADGGDDNDPINGGGGRDTITGGGGGDSITGGDEAGPGDIWLGGDAGIDYVYGGLGNDRLDGGGDGDTLNGQDGADTVTGGLGIDYLYGGSGIDYLEGGASNDQMTGGADADTFDSNPGSALDSVVDFTDNVDTIRIDTAFGFADVAAVLARTIQSGNHARILLNATGTDSVYLLNYLTPGSGHTIASLGDDIYIA